MVENPTVVVLDGAVLVDVDNVDEVDTVAEVIVVTV